MGSRFSACFSPSDSELPEIGHQLVDAENVFNNTRITGGFGRPASNLTGDMTYVVDQSGYSDVRIQIHDTFPLDASKYGTVYIQINKPETPLASNKGKEKESATTRTSGNNHSNIILCGGRPHASVSAELEKRLDMTAAGFTVVFIPPPLKTGKKLRLWGTQTMNVPHFVGFHNHPGKIHIAWASAITGIVPKTIHNVPVVWKTSDDVVFEDREIRSSFEHKSDVLPTVVTDKWKQPAEAGGMKLVDIRPCYAQFTFWFTGCRATVSPMVEVSVYDAKQLLKPTDDS